ncbi:LOW QUALITY PROTEIN: splicing factor, arginine/serine-rich 19 [Chelonoidis abingdonii]|uniref:LOW QUALITY PROTEIN: splicing factor, arginine/serine-rich 19 n=1 Tax=Chelonoidis abingdonii TaxID=106734 RepID=UPI003F4922D4
MEEEENPVPPASEDPVGGSEEQGRPSDAPPDRESCQSGALCTEQVVMLQKALQQVVSGSFQSERLGRAGEKDAERKMMSRKKWCQSPHADGSGSGKRGTGDPIGTCDRSSTVPEALGLFSGLAGALQFLQRSCAASMQTRLLLGDEGLLGPPGICGDVEPDEVELVAEVRLGDVAAASGIFRRERAWRVHKSGLRPARRLSSERELAASCPSRRWTIAVPAPVDLSGPTGLREAQPPTSTARAGLGRMPWRGRVAPPRALATGGSSNRSSSGHSHQQAGNPEAQRSRPPPRTGALEKDASKRPPPVPCLRRQPPGRFSAGRSSRPPAAGTAIQRPVRRRRGDLGEPPHQRNEDKPGRGTVTASRPPGQKCRTQKDEPLDATAFQHHIRPHAAPLRADEEEERGGEGSEMIGQSRRPRPTAQSMQHAARRPGLGRRRGRRSRSGSRARHKEKHRDGGGSGKKKKKQQRSRSWEKRPPRDKQREVHVLEEPKAEERRRDARTVVPPSIQDLNDTDLFTIKRTITVSRQDGSPEPAKREVLYDSEGLSFEGCFSDREPAEGPRHLGSKGEGGLPRKERPEEEAKPPKEKERKRGYPEERPAPREKSKKRFKEAPGRSAPEAGKAEKEKSRPEREKPPRKAKAGHKDSGKAGGSGRKVKLQSKVAVLIREGVSSTTVSGKEGGSIGIKFSRDKESRSPFLKPEEKGPGAEAKAEPAKEPGGKAKKLKGLKAKAGLKKAKGPGAKAKGPSEAKKKKKLKAKTGLKKSKADSCSQGAGSPPAPAPEPMGGAGSPLSPPPKLPPAPASGMTPDSQTVEQQAARGRCLLRGERPAVPAPGRAAERPAGEPRHSPREARRSLPAALAPPASPAPMAWNLQGAWTATTSGVLALTALLLRWGVPTWRPGQGRIQAGGSRTSPAPTQGAASSAGEGPHRQPGAQQGSRVAARILSHTKPSTSLAGSQAPAPPPTHTAAPYLLHGSLPLGGCSSTPPTPTGLPGSLGPASAGTGSGTLFGTGSGSDLGKRDGSTSSDGRGDTDKYLKKLHTQERAVEEVKLAIKPYYQKKEITKEEYKDILRKAVHKICHSKSGEINPVKVNNLVRAYVQRYKYFRKHGRRMEEEPGGPKDLGGLEKASLPMPPL